MRHLIEKPNPMRNQKHPFPFDVEASQVMRSFADEVKTTLRKRQETLINTGSIQYFQHGMTWQSHHSYDPDLVAEVQSYEDSINIQFEDVILGKTDIVQQKIKELADTMSRSFSKSFFTTISDTCETHGNVVDAASGLAVAFIEMLEKIEFSVDRDGNVSLPQIFGGHGLLEMLSQNKEMNTEEYKSKVEEITQRKSQEALQREISRKAKFLKED
ncbi:hypothetical protein [Pseudomonas oryzihabitans]|uniref:hypothetical protein n=1 Tax=Pseudomonas oryzihabitans TaxID=47885 RepID=UPI00241E500B|nr:hypothetical protein [Pseudomonas oryzihabitans]